jgi:signal peptidase I
MPMDNDWLDLAIQSFRNNDLTRARELLWGYVNYHRNDARGWLWYSRVQTRREDKFACLQRARALAPNDPTILAEWERLVGNAPLWRNVTAHAPSPARAARMTPPAPRRAPASARVSRGAARAPLETLARVLQFCVLLGALVLFLVALFSVLPMFFGSRTLVILSGSMEPTIPTGGMVLAQPVPSRSLEIGDIIVFSPGAESQIPIVHRIVNISERRGTRYYTTRGDANPNADVAEVALPATAWRVVLSVPLVGYLIAWAASPPGIFFLIVLPLIGLVILTAWDWLRQHTIVRGAPRHTPRSLPARAR